MHKWRLYKASNHYILVFHFDIGYQPNNIVYYRNTVIYYRIPTIVFTIATVSQYWKVYLYHQALLVLIILCTVDIFHTGYLVTIERFQA